VSVAARTDEDLISRLRQLSLVELDALLSGASGTGQRSLLDSYAEDLHDALAAARARMQALLAVAAQGPDPLALLDAAPAVRAREGAIDAARRASERMAARADACRSLARLDDATALLLPRLLEADRRRPG
jgi:hypothetical protein